MSHVRLVGFVMGPAASRKETAPDLRHRRKIRQLLPKRGMGNQEGTC